MKKNIRGISLIVLIITIIVIVVLAGAIVLTLTGNNPIIQANKATYLSDLKNFETELELYKTNELTDKLGLYDFNLLQADDTSVTYNGTVLSGKTLNDLVPALDKKVKYVGQFKVVDGKLIYQGSDTNIQNWSMEMGTEVIVAGEPKVTIFPTEEEVVTQGTDVVFTVRFSSNAALTTVDLTDKVEVLDNNDVALSVQPSISVNVSGTNLDATRQAYINVATNNLKSGSYKLKIKSGVVTDANNISNLTDTISLIGFDVVDIIPPENPVISSNPSGWTNGNVDISVNYSLDSIVKEYSTDGVNWNSYIAAISVSENGITIYARGKDSSGNESGVATLTVGNIDRIVPQDFSPSITNLGSSSFNINANTVDTLSGIIIYEYYINDILKTSSIQSTYLFTQATKSTTYSVYVIAKDAAGNIKKSSTIQVQTLVLGGTNLGIQSADFTAFMGTPQYLGDSVYLTSTSILATVTNYTVTYPYTIILQCKNLILGPGTSYGGVFGLGYGGSGVGGTWLGIFMIGSTLYTANGVSDAYTIIAPGSKLVANQWNTLVIRQDATKSSFFINNQLIATVAAPPPTKTSKIYIGGFSNSGTSSAGVNWGYVNGYYRNFAVFNRALTDIEITNFTF